MPSIPIATPTEVAVERCSDLWFQDGTLVIQCYEMKDGAVTAIREFRVYRGILEKHSDGILSNQEGLTHLVSDEVDGCPVLPLYDDPVDDVTRLLKMLYIYGCVTEIISETPRNLS